MHKKTAPNTATCSERFFTCCDCVLASGHHRQRHLSPSLTSFGTRLLFNYSINPKPQSDTSNFRTTIYAAPPHDSLHPPHDPHHLTSYPTHVSRLPGGDPRNETALVSYKRTRADVSTTNDRACRQLHAQAGATKSPDV